jgi:pimeloyl-ACP methyl ester carboxylesterase
MSPMRIVFVHGYGCGGEDWDAQRAALAPRHEVFAPDLPGHGKTPGAPRDASIARFASEVAKLIEPATLLVGHSMGCRVVLEGARNNSSKVAGIVLIDGSRIGSASQIDALGYARFIDGFFGAMIPNPLLQSDALLARAKRMPADFGTALFRDIVRWDAAELDAALAAVRVPLLAIQSTAINAEGKRVLLKAGESSPWLDLLRSRIPSAKIRILSGVGHFTQIEAAGEVSRLIGDFSACAPQERRR